MGLLQINIPEKLHDILRAYSSIKKIDMKDIIINTLEEKYGKLKYEIK
jgi:hypothetical protein